MNHGVGVVKCVGWWRVGDGVPGESIWWLGSASEDSQLMAGFAELGAQWLADEACGSGEGDDHN
jgi:hypothetical protein